MMEKDAAARLGKQLLKVMEKNKFVLLILLAGLLLLLLPSFGGGTEKETSASAAPATSVTFDLEELEGKLAGTLSQVEGAGKVSVLLTLKSGTRQILAQDITTSRKDGAADEGRTTVVVSGGSGKEEAVPLQQIYPQFQGALVVCSGGDDPGVKLKLIEAVSALTGLGADKISICKSK